MNKPIRILYDEWGFQETHGGVSRLFSEVMKNLPEGFEWVLPQTCTVNEYLKLPPFNLPSAKLTYREFVKTNLGGRSFPGSNRLYHALGWMMPTKFPAHEVINYKARMRALKAGNYDIYHLTAAHWCSYDWRVVAGKKPIVVTVCDLIPEIIDHNKVMFRYRRPLLEAASHIIAITECTKKDLIRLYGVPAEKISVVYLGANMSDDDSLQDTDALDSLVDCRYILYVGKRGGYKNFNWLVRAVAPLLRNANNPMRLFCTGAPFTESERRMFRELGVEGSIIQKFVTDSELKWLYKHAVCFVHPSLYEGFGIPILDAFAAGCPALISNTSCFPEVAGDAAMYFDPKGDGVRLCMAIIRLCEDLELYNRYVGRGQERACEFSWRKCAEETALTYARLIS